MTRPGAVLALDLGEKKTGFAVADATRVAVHALETARLSGPDLLEHVAELLGERDVATLLVGLPLHMDGTRGPRAAAVEAFASELRARFPAVEVVTFDERLTTKEAEDLLRRSGFRGKDAKARRDSWSALVLLRDWIESGEPR